MNEVLNNPFDMYPYQRDGYMGQTQEGKDWTDDGQINGRWADLLAMYFRQ